MSFLENCKRTEAPIDEGTTASMALHLRTMHHLIGLQTELGELVDAYKKTIYYGQPLDTVNVLEEVGDLEYYLELFCDSVGVDRAQARETVVNKLKLRYPDKFTQKDAIDRDLGAERAILRTGAVPIDDRPPNM
jgi:NTP pyrophosphatase (non-canonical NTP hydrolase)